jgi:acetyl esterase/lipase
MKFPILFLCTFLACGCLSGQTNVWQPSPGYAQIPIWPATAPDLQPAAGPEMATTTGKDSLVAGRPFVLVDNVTRPTMTVYAPKGTNTGIAVVVFPGGGYNELAIDLEGTEVCEWLASNGITGVLLKYRVPGSGPHYDAQLKRHAEPKAPTALEDAQRTMGLVRLHAAEWKINSHKVGVMGFSAGGHLVANISTHFERRLYPAVDAADRESCRPDFGVAIYPGHMTENTTNAFDLNPTVPVSTNMPPQFVLMAEDDNVDGVEQALVYYIGLQKAGVPAELHLYAQGGHGFGLRRTKLPITGWPDLVQTWLRTIGISAD